jgi:hypothetical protein
MPSKTQKEKNRRRRKARKTWTKGAKVGWKSGNQVLPATVVEDRGPVKGSDEHLVMVRVPSSASTTTTFMTTSGQLVVPGHAVDFQVTILPASEER